MTRSCLRLLLTALVLASTPVAAQIYTWTDEEGVRHYSQQPPPKGTEGVTRMDAGEGAVGGVESAPDASGSGNGSAGKAPKGEAAEETLADYCKGLRADLDLLESDRPIKVKSGDGKLQQMGDERRAQRLAQTRDQIAENCQGNDGGAG